MHQPTFPGMDPFIEDQRWQEFHNALVIAVQQELARLLVPRYSVISESYIELHMRPDVSVSRGQPDTEPLETLSLATADATRTITPTIYEIDEQQRIEIRDEAGRLVTVLEVLSPANKSRHRDRYLANRDAILSSATHLVEIDLLLGGQRTEPDFPDEGYVILVARAQKDKAHHGDVYEFSLRDALPVIPVPLSPDDPDVPLNLPELVRGVYVAARYRLQLDYSRPLAASLSSNDRAWIDSLLPAR